MRTIKTIIEDLKKIVENKEILSPSHYVSQAEFINILIGDEIDKLLDLEQKVAQQKMDLLSINDNKVNKVNIILEATDLYKETQKQKALIKQAEEMVKIAKLQARLKQSEMYNQN